MVAIGNLPPAFLPSEGLPYETIAALMADKTSITRTIVSLNTKIGTPLLMHPLGTGEGHGRDIDLAKTDSIGLLVIFTAGIVQWFHSDPVFGRETILLLNYVSRKVGGFAIGDKDIVILKTPYPMKNGVFLQHLDLT